MQLDLQKEKNMKKETIQKCIKEHYQEALSLGYNVVVCFLRGSQNYELDIYTKEYQSDVDTVCFILPSIDDLIKNTPMKSIIHVRENNEHIEIKDIRIFAKTLQALMKLSKNMDTIQKNYITFLD